MNPYILGIHGILFEEGGESQLNLPTVFRFTIIPTFHQRGKYKPKVPSEESALCKATSLEHDMHYHHFAASAKFIPPKTSVLNPPHSRKAGVANRKLPPNPRARACGETFLVGWQTNCYVLASFTDPAGVFDRCGGLFDMMPGL